ncbi:MAG: enoyl-CoA hydratase/isomerase family protein [Betaproteobacteria bacterium]|nr:enoyl-CoA hydratase/isomerase family protein [Betaproteobacteria bacterium]
MSEQMIVLEDCGKYACITLNRADRRNALNRVAQLEFQSVLRQCVGRFPSVLLTGAGPAFCVGTDPEEGRDAGAHDPEFSRQGQSWIETLDMIRKHPAVFIAAVNGEALGDGVSLINVCDLAIAAEDAGIGLPEITSARYPALAGPTTQLRILRKHASWMILTGKRIDGRMAARWGLVNMAVPGSRLMDEARAVAENIAKFNPVTIDWTKKAIDDIPAHVSDWTAALEYGRVITAVVQNQIGKDKVMPGKF